MAADRTVSSIKIVKLHLFSKNVFDSEDYRISRCDWKYRHLTFTHALDGNPIHSSFPIQMRIFLHFFWSEVLPFSEKKRVKKVILTLLSQTQLNVFFPVCSLPR